MISFLNWLKSLIKPLPWSLCGLFELLIDLPKGAILEFRFTESGVKGFERLKYCLNLPNQLPKEPGSLDAVDFDKFRQIYLNIRFGQDRLRDDQRTVKVKKVSPAGNFSPAALIVEDVMPYVEKLTIFKPDEEPFVYTDELGREIYFDLYPELRPPE
jgi:hypothetical protein